MKNYRQEKIIRKMIKNNKKPELKKPKLINMIRKINLQLKAIYFLQIKMNKMLNKKINN